MAGSRLLNHRYELLRRAGDGASGAVFVVRDTHEDELRALKLLTDAQAAASDLVAEFKRLTRLDHPNLATVFALDRASEAVPGIAAGTPFFISSLARGVDPATAVLAAGDPVTMLLAIADGIAAALAHLHAAGLIHRDVKPSNILVDGDREPPGVTLVDLGLAGPPAVAGPARGTPAFMCREAFAGEASPHTDLYALGATLFQAACGAPPFGDSSLADVARAVMAGQAPPVTAGAPWLPEPLAELIDRLLAPVGERPSTAEVVRDQVAQVREALGSTTGAPARRSRAQAALMPPMLVSRESAVTALTAALADPAIAVARLCGPPGSGRHAVLREAIRRRQLAAIAEVDDAVDVVEGDADQLLERLAGRLDTELPPLTDPERAAAQMTDRLLELAARVGEERALALVLDDRGDDERAAAIERAALAGHRALRAGSVTLIRFATDATPPAVGDDRCRLIEVEPLDVDGLSDLVTSMIGRRPRRAWCRDLAAATGGLPRLIVEAVRAATAAGAVEDSEPATLVGSTDSRGFARLVVGRVAHLAADQAALIEALAVLGGRARPDALAAVIDGDGDGVVDTSAALVAEGLVQWRDGRLELPTPAHRRAVHAAIPGARRRALHRRALSWCETHEPDPVTIAEHLLETGPASRAVTASRSAASALRGRGLRRRARELLDAAAAIASGPAAAELRADLAEVACELGDYDAAIAAATSAARSRRGAVKRRAALALARAQQKSGLLDEAEATLARLHRQDPDDREIAGAYGKLLLTRGRPVDAAGAVGDPPLTGPLAAGDAVGLEVAGLAALYAGDPTAADRRFRALEHRAGSGGDDALVGRALALLGTTAQSRGEIATAATLYERAASRARAASDIHAAAVYELNRASAHAEAGRHGDALDALEEAMIELGRLGDVPELASALYNRGVELLVVGEVAAARSAATRARAVADAHGNPTVAVYARLLDGDIDRRIGDLSAAAAAYRDALRQAEEAGGARERMLAHMNLALALAEAGDAAATDELAAATEQARAEDDRGRLAVAGARIHLELGLDPGANAGELDDTRRRLRASGRVDQAWRADLVAARVAHARGDDDRARQLGEEARELFDELLSQTPEARRAGFAADPDAVALAALGEAVTQRPTADPSSAPPVRDLRRLLQLSRRLNSELRLTPLLDQVIDTVIELTSAERGFLLLLSPGDGARDLDVVVARNFAQDALARDEQLLSRSIAERAARTGEVVLTVDAAFDERFGAAESVAAMRLRSVLAVPLRQKGRITGTIYVDHRFRSAAFDDDAIELVRELADIAAVAIENARLIEENQRRQRAIDELNRRLSDEVVEKETELATVKARLAASDRDGLRHAYDAIVGGSPPMLEMLTLLDRATDTGLPVVITGESGTGKELVARALHENGPRRGQPFVAINCGAVPESLLESELFGHVRGAFTGADRDRPGVFEVANRGTLFLDEVADTSLAMQAKLLRALQESEIRRVGDHATRKVDVRVVAATNRALDQLVADGAFREDLYYRLSVMTLRVPPLRERIEDIAPLAEHILRRVAGEPVTLDKAALARLASHSWPGNVRELENELARASALASGGRITADDLSDRLSRAVAPPVRTDADDLALKPRVEALERALVDEALRRSAGNQTQAARLLGLSRYGLQKKLKRYGISGSL